MSKVNFVGSKKSREETKNRRKPTTWIFKIACNNYFLKNKKATKIIYTTYLLQCQDYLLRFWGFFPPYSISFTLSAICWTLFDRSCVCSSMWLNRRSTIFLSEAERFLSRSSCWVNSWILMFSFYKNTQRQKLIKNHKKKKERTHELFYNPPTLCG